MLQKPDLKDEKIIACLKNEYGLRVDKIAFLPLGDDINKAVRSSSQTGLRTLVSCLFGR
jgi:hypothetical protein